MSICSSKMILLFILLAGCSCTNRQSGEGHKKASGKEARSADEQRISWDTLHTGTYRICYPSDWQVQQKKPQAELVLVMPREGDKDVFSENVYLNIYQGRDMDTLTIEAWKRIAYQDLQSDYPSISFFQDTATEWLGRPAWKFVYQVREGGFTARLQQIMVQLPGKSLAVVFTYGADDADYVRILPIVERIRESLVLY